MKILFVAMSNSIHTARWISQIADQGWDIHLFPSYDVGAVHPNLKNVTVHHGSPRFGAVGKKVESQFKPTNRAIKLARLIKELQPDLIHSLEFQGAGYLTLAAQQQYQGKFPRWIVTSWGSDIYYFGRFPEHKIKIEALLQQVDYFWCESKRDVKLAQQFGFVGTSLPTIPAAGGFNLAEITELSSGIKPSQRKMIMLKGYHGWAGRANVGLTALQRCVDLLQGYEIVMFSTQLASRIAARRFTFATKIPITILPAGTSHTAIIERHGKARTSIGLSITDGVPNAMLEAMAMGSLPIQSITSCADEWLEDGKGGLFVPAEDSEKIAQAIRKALTDDQFVDSAALINKKTVESRLDEKKIKPQVVSTYKGVL